MLCDVILMISYIEELVSIGKWRINRKGKNIKPNALYATYQLQRIKWQIIKMHTQLH